MYNKQTEAYRLKQVHHYEAALLSYWQTRGLKEKQIGILFCLLNGNQDLRDACGRYPRKSCNQIRIRHHFRSKQELLDLIEQSGMFVMTDGHIIPTYPSFEELGLEPETVADRTTSPYMLSQNATDELQNAAERDVNINKKSTTISTNSNSIDTIETSSTYPSFYSSESEARCFFKSLDGSHFPDKAVVEALYGFVEVRFEGIGREEARRYMKMLVESLVGYLDSQPKFRMQTHKERCLWVINIIRSRQGTERLEHVLQTHLALFREQQTREQQAQQAREVEERRARMHDNHPISAYEYSADCGQRLYDLEGKPTRIPTDAPPRPSADAYWDNLERNWKMDNSVRTIF